MLWHELANLVDNKRDWIVIGDMNMVEQIMDRRGGFGHILDGVQKNAFRRFKRKLDHTQLTV